MEGEGGLVAVCTPHSSTIFFVLLLTQKTNATVHQNDSTTTIAIPSNVIVRHKDDSFASNWTTFNTPTSAVFIVVIQAELTNKMAGEELKGTNITLTCKLYVVMDNNLNVIVLSILCLLYAFSLLSPHRDEEQLWLPQSH